MEHNTLEMLRIIKLTAENADDPEVVARMKEIEERTKKQEEEAKVRRQKRKESIIAEMREKTCPAIGGEKCKAEKCVCFSDDGTCVRCMHYHTIRHTYWA